MNYYLVTAKVTPSDTADGKTKFKTILVHVMYMSAQKLNKKIATDEVAVHIQNGLAGQQLHKESYVYSVSLTQFKKIPVDTIVKH